jgi:DNA-binding response OmpR family regulator
MGTYWYSKSKEDHIACGIREMTPEVGDCGRLRVLVVDDDRDAADSLATLVELWGHDARIRYDAASAFEGACSYRPHVVLLDIGLPKIDGHQLAREIRQHAGKEAILIAVTGYADEAHRSRCESAFDHYLVKPAPLEEVERLLAIVKKTTKVPPQSSSDTIQAGNTFSVGKTETDTRPPHVPSAIDLA